MRITHQNAVIFDFPGPKKKKEKKSRILWESTPAFSRTNAHYKPLQHHTPCACVGYSTAVPLNLLNASFSARSEIRRLVSSASEPISSRCLCGSAVDWLNASFKSPPRLFKFKKTPGPLAVSSLTFAGELNVYFFATGGARDLAGCRRCSTFLYKTPCPF